MIVTGEKIWNLVNFPASFGFEKAFTNIERNLVLVLKQKNQCDKLNEKKNYAIKM